MGTRTLDRIWRSEAAYFDGEADAALRSRWPSDEVLIARYAKSSQVWFNKEYRFSRLGDLRGKRVLDVGCGLGDNTVFLAARGADVTGVDLSEKSIAVARERVARLELPLQPRFVCAPLETADLPLESFDVIWGDGFLHHVLHDLDGGGIAPHDLGEVERAAVRGVVRRRSAAELPLGAGGVAELVARRDQDGRALEDVAADGGGLTPHHAEESTTGCACQRDDPPEQRATGGAKTYGPSRSARPSLPAGRDLEPRGGRNPPGRGPV